MVDDGDGLRGPVRRAGKRDLGAVVSVGAGSEADFSVVIAVSEAGGLDLSCRSSSS